MKLFEIYTNEVLLPEFWSQLEEELEINEADGLGDLLSSANKLVFDRFGINPNEKKYFIAGSARLYLYPQLRDAFGLESKIGDLDIVIPNKEDWIKAGLEDEWNGNGIYRPEEDDRIEVFNVWDPSKAGGEYADLSVRPTDEILKDSANIGGYFYMPITDVIDYKIKMSRDKEQDVVNLINQYRKSGSTNRSVFLRRMAKLIGLDKTKKFLDIINK